MKTLNFIRYLEKGYAWLGRLRRLLYRKRIFSSKKVDIPIVSVGNIASGGVGKTPVAIFIAEQLTERYKVCTVSRGYRAPAEKKREPIVVSEWGQLTENSSEGGDEPLLLAKRLPLCSVIAGKNRYLGALQAKKMGGQIVVLDDGFQHLQLSRDFDIVVMDATDLEPRYLRESKASLEDADLLFVTRFDECKDDERQEIEKLLAKHSKASLVGCSLQKPQAFCAQGNPFQLKGKSVLLACGIAHPHRFFSTVQKMGASVMGAYSWKDHGIIGEKKLQKWVDQHKGIDCVLFTEKDWVRFTSPPSLSVPVGFVTVDLGICYGHAAWQKAKSLLVSNSFAGG